MRKIILLNIYLFLFWISASSFALLGYPFLPYLKSLSALLISFPLLGINIAGITQIYHAEKFSKIEILSLASIFALIIAPLLVSLEYEFFGMTSPAFPIINSALSLFLLIFLYRKNKRTGLDNFNFPSLDGPNRQIMVDLAKAPLLPAFFFNLFSIAIAFSAFDTLPELDPYYWYYVFLEKISQGSLTSLSGYRPLFISLIYIFNQSASVDLYAFFKYILPLFSLLILIPAYLVIGKEKNKLKQFSILLVPFITSSAFLYSQIPIPQAIFNIILFYFLFFLIYSQLTEKSFFYFLAGFIAFFSYFYHEGSVIIFAVWLITTVFFYFGKITAILKNNLLSTFLFCLVIFSNFSEIISQQAGFISRYLAKLLVFGHFNFLFPAYYINIDGNEMGWGNLLGVAKYYAYYAGPALLVIFIFLTYSYFSNPEFRKFFIAEARKKESIILISLLAIFFSISEILPRFFNLAFLPERAWMFSGIFSLVFVFYIFKSGTKKLFPILLILALFINLGGALYINNLKKYVITQDQLASAEWINQSLPGNRVFFSNGNANLLKLYSGSKYVEIPNSFYFNDDSYRAEMDKFESGELGLQPDNYKRLAEALDGNISKLGEYDPDSDRKIISDTLQKNISDSQALLKLLPSDIRQKPPANGHLYIYYSEIDRRNPYANRPYSAPPTHPDEFIFDKYPEKFQKIYTNPKNNTIIWKIL